jgi:hypothetical protein
MIQQQTTSKLNTPVLFIIFNRPQTTVKVFEAIRKARPVKLFIAADGPRNDKPSDRELSKEARNIASKVDWPCEVKTLFRENNLGCGFGPVAAIDWFFDNVEDGIILEDDCVPDQSFFYFCQELLERYKDNEKIMHVSGNNFQYGKKRGFSSYYFSKYTHNWGWATWRRAWKYNDHSLSGPEDRKHTWDKQWLKSVEKQNGLAILPNVNLISNIGSGEDATHTKGATRHLFLSAQAISFPLIHPKIIMRHRIADFWSYRDIFGGSYGRLIFNGISKLVPGPIKRLFKHSSKK